MPKALTVDQQLQKLRKLPCNKICLNCGNENKFGHPNVVSIIFYDYIIVPYKTFVCHNCKSAHQSFSHLVKV